MEPDISALRGPILILGGQGFIGANLFLYIRRHRKDVFAVVRKRQTWRLAEVEPDAVLEVDLNDEQAVRTLLDERPPQTVFDCASYGAFSFEKDATLIHKTNYLAIVNFVELLSRKPFAAFIHAGTSSEYGLNSAGPAEDAKLCPNSHYAVSKAAMAHYIHFAGVVRNLPCVNLRFYTVYGPLDDTSHLVPTVIFEGLHHRYPPLVDPDVSRDFVFVDDVCEAFVRAAARMTPAMYGQSYNIGTGRATTIRELANIARQAFSIEEEPRFGSMENRGWDVTNWYANPDRARTDLGWVARTKLEDGLQQVRAWVESLTPEEFASRTKARGSVKKRSVSAIIACYLDEQAIPIMYERLTSTFTKIGCDYEIIFVNDGSPDACGERIRELSAKDTHVLGISHSRNFGSQMAFRSGMELSTKDGVVLLDGDLQDPPERIEQFYEQWEAGYEVVFGRRVKRDMPFIWGLLYKGFYRILTRFSYIKIPHDAGDFSLMDRRVVGWLLQCPERDLFLRGLRAYVGFRQIGVDYVRPKRMFGSSTNNLMRNIGWAKKGLFSYSNAPLNMLTEGGAFLLFLSAIAGLTEISLRLSFPQDAPRGVTTILLFVLFFGALNLFAIGILGEYVGKIIEEVKDRPRLIRANIIRNGHFVDVLPDGSVRR